MLTKENESTDLLARLQKPLKTSASWLVLFMVALPMLAQAAQPVLPEGLPEPVIPQGFGINIHFVEPEASSLERISEGGYSFVRMDLKWERVERERGLYDFSAYDKLTDAMRERRVRMLYILDYGNKLYGDGLAPRTEEDRAAFARFAVAAARHFAGRGVVWAIWNEPNNAQFWKPAVNAEEYALLAVRAAREMHAAEPKACILAPSSSTFQWSYLEAAFRHGLLHEIDGVSVHPYRESAPETVVEDYARLRQLIAVHTRPGDPQRPIICSEWGYATYEASNGFSKDIQAAYLVRSWLSNLAAGVNLSIYYDLRDDGVDPTDREHHFGVLNHNLIPKPAFIAAKALVKDLQGYRFLHRLNRPATNDWALLFRRGKNLALVTWNSDIHASVEAQTPVIRLLRPTELCGFGPVFNSSITRPFAGNSGKPVPDWRRDSSAGGGASANSSAQTRRKAATRIRFADRSRSRHHDADSGPRFLEWACC
jgi:polysaccharide biosynthesis protein PslG